MNPFVIAVKSLDRYIVVHIYVRRSVWEVEVHAVPINRKHTYNQDTKYSAKSLYLTAPNIAEISAVQQKKQDQQNRGVNVKGTSDLPA